MYTRKKLCLIVLLWPETKKKIEYRQAIKKLLELKNDKNSV